MKNKTTAAVLAFLLGGVGAHKFYLGQTGAGLLYLFFFWTWIPALLALFDFIVLLMMDEHAFNLKYNGVFVAAATGPGPIHTQNTQAQNITINMPPSVAGHSAQPVVAQPAAVPALKIDIVAQLAKLNDLRIAGALTDEEFQVQKQKLLAAEA